jgi:hypothetical protein
VTARRPWPPASRSANGNELEQIVREFDVRYRVGLTRDVTYGSGTVPIVFWNPRVIDLP